MKRLFLILILIIPLKASAQSSSISDFFKDYVAAEGFTSVQFERKMMQLMSRQAALRGDKALSNLLDDIQYIRIVAMKEGDGEQFIGDAENAVASAGKFHLLTSGTEDGQTTKFYIGEVPGSLRTDLVMITYGVKETVVVNIYGKFDLKQVARLSSIRPK